MIDVEPWRARAFLLNKRDVIMSMLPGQQECRHVLDLPEGAKVADVSYDIRYAAWVVIVEHPSYPEVLPGQEVPPEYVRRVVCKKQEEEQ